jgi:CRISPR-associated protein Cas5d
MQGRPFLVRARGPVACFTRPEMKAERVSYEVMTPSAARGILESILWKPAIRWHVHSIAVLAPIDWVSFRRNEVSDRASPKILDFYAEERRAQRNTVALRNVDYVITASFSLTEKAGPGDNLTKFEEMFERRLAKGQTFQQPYLGCRELAAEVEPAPEVFHPIHAGADRPLGLMLYDFVYDPEGHGARPLFFEARLDRGVLAVPPLGDVLRDNVRAERSDAR